MVMVMVMVMGLYRSFNAHKREMDSTLPYPRVIGRVTGEELAALAQPSP